MPQVSTMPDISRRTRNLIVLLLMAAHLAIVLPQAYLLNIWVDEASTLYATQNGFWIAFQNAATEQKQAPLYFWIMSLWRSIDGSIFFARLFSVLCSLAAVRLFAGLAGRFVPPFAAVLLTAFFALHPYLIWASLEIRVYALVILLSIVLLRLFFIAFWDADPSDSARKPRYPKIWLLFAVIIALYTNYYLGFLIVGLFASLLATRRWRASRDFALLMVPASIAFFPLLFDLVKEFQSKSSGFQEERSLLEGLRGVWNHILTFVLPTEIFPAGEQSVMSSVRVWFVRLGIVLVTVLAIWKRKQITSQTITIGIITITIGIFLLVAYFLIGRFFIEIRHASVLFVPLLLLTASLLADVTPKLGWNKIRVVTAAGGLIVLVFFSYSIVTLYPNMTKRGDWARVGKFIEQHESPGQPIVLFEAFDALALPYHYRGVSPILPDENYFDFGLQAPMGTAKSLARQNDFVISKIPPDATQIWLVVNDQCISTEACRPLENFVESNYTIELEKEFHLSKVYLLKRKDQ